MGGKLRFSHVRKHHRLTSFRRGLTLVVAGLSGLSLFGGPVTAAATPAATVSPTASTFTPVQPDRVLDTRIGLGAPTGPVGPGAAVALDLSSRLPATATAVVLNVTGTEPTAPTYVTVSPHGDARPIVSNLNLVPGQTRPNLVTVAVGAGRTVDLFNAAGSVHLVADLMGFYSTGSGSRYTTLTPRRLLDTRTSSSPVGAGGTVSVDVTEFVPASATAVTFNLTATTPTAPTFVTAWPHGAARPGTSNVNVVAGETAPNLVTVPVGADRKVDLYNAVGSVHLIADLDGFYTADYGALFAPVSPTRVLDTRDGTGTPNGQPGKVGPGDQSAFYHRMTALVPTAAVAALLNLTGTEPTNNTYVEVGDGSYFPHVSNLNLTAGQTAANLAVPGIVRYAEPKAPDGIGRAVKIYNDTGSVHVIADLAGYFVLPPGNCQTGCVYTWGYWSWPQPGADPQTTPRLVSGLNGATAIAGEVDHGYALLADGTVRAWGYNGSGKLGIGWSWSNSWSPAPVIGLNSVVAISAAQSTAYALRSDGSVWGWGNSGSGELGPYQPSNVPVRIPGLADVTAITAGLQNGYALRSDGTVLAWGANDRGQLGDGSTSIESLDPVQVAGLSGVRSIASRGATAYALKADGTLWAWGENADGELGSGAACDKNTGAGCLSRTPVQVSGLTGVKAIAASERHGFAATNDGAAFAWGDNLFGGLGNGVLCVPPATGPNCTSTVPVRVSGLTNVKSVAGFSDGGYATRDDGTLWGWGNNGGGYLANGDVRNPNYTTVPVQLSTVVSGATTVTGGLALVPGQPARP